MDVQMRFASASIGKAVAENRITGLAVALEALRAAGAFDDPSFFPAASELRYTRRLLWSDPDGRFIVVAMTWGPGQGTPLHDHSGLWGGEIVVNGTMAETTYELTGQSDGRWRFRKNDEVAAPPGTVGMLSPPFEYHRLRNAGEAAAHTIHVYAGNLSGARCFDEIGDGWYSASTVKLGYDD